MCEEAGRQTLLIPGDISEDAQCQCVHSRSACLAARALPVTSFIVQQCDPCGTMLKTMSVSVSIFNLLPGSHAQLACTIL